jgi:voltage-gated potassium channel
MRKRLFEIIEADDPADGYDTASTIYDAVMIILIVLSLLPLTVKEDPPIYTLFERVTVAVFTLDYLLRWATADYKFRESGLAPFLRYPFSPMAIVDLLSILPTLMMIHPAFRLLRVMRLLRALRVLRVIKVVRYSGTIRILSEVLRESRQPLAAVLSLAVGYIILAALVMFTVEAESFDNYFEAVYWATMSLTTVGYGDIYPITAIGRVVTMVSSLMGIAIIALPSSIITAGYIRALNRRMEPQGTHVEMLPTPQINTEKTEKV